MQEIERGQPTFKAKLILQEKKKQKKEKSFFPVAVNRLLSVSIVFLLLRPSILASASSPSSSNEEGSIHSSPAAFNFLHCGTKELCNLFFCPWRDYKKKMGCLGLINVLDVLGLKVAILTNSHKYQTCHFCLQMVMSMETT